MSGYPLKSVLDLRRRAEEAAAARFADATRERFKAEAEDVRRAAEVTAARTRLENAQGGGVSVGESRDPQSGRPDPGSTVSGATAAGQSRFVARRRDDLKRAEVALFDFRSGALAQARGAEASARVGHQAARRAREAFDKHEAKFRAGERTVSARREEETLEDVARATRHPRRDDRP